MDKITPVNCYTIKPVFWQKGALPIGLEWEWCFLPSAFYRKLANHKNGILALRLLDDARKAVLGGVCRG